MIEGFKITEQGDVCDKLYKHRDNYHLKGKYLGFELLHKHYSMSLGNCTDWTGYPQSGKTQFLMECLINTSKFYEWKHLVYFPDVGNNVEIVADLIQKKTGKSFDPNANNVITDKEITYAMEWVIRHFSIVTRENTKGKITPQSFWEWAAELKSEYGLHTASIDSWKDMNHDYEKYGGYAQYLEYILPLRNHIAEENNLHFHTIIHPKLTEKENGKRNAPNPYDLKGGSEWYNSGKCMITVHRENPEYNEADIIFNKIKPRSNGEPGMIKMKFDKSSLCYYLDENIGGNFVKLFACEENKQQTVSNSFPTKQLPKQEPDIVNGKELLSFSEKMKQTPF
jgi:hypothetical protein